MPVQLLPASAAAFAPKASSVSVVLGLEVQPWLTKTLKAYGPRCPLNNVYQHQKVLTELFSSPEAIWTLASLMLPKLPEAEMPQDPPQNLFNYQLVHIEAYIVHIDMVLRDEVAYKLTSDTIDALVEYYDMIHCVDTKASTSDRSEKENKCKKLREDFVLAVNKFVYRAPVKALEGMERGGSGELLFDKSEEVKNTLLGLMKPLPNQPVLPPPPCVVHQPPLLPKLPPHDMLPQHTMHSALRAVEPWRVLLSSPSVTSTSAGSSTPVCTTMSMSNVQNSQPSPAYLQPHTAALYFNSALIPAAMPTQVPLPSMLGDSRRCIHAGVGGFGWDRLQEYALAPC